MKKLNIITIAWLLSFTLAAQSLSPEVIASSGEYFESANNSISFTLGEIATETYSNGNNILTQGFQQPEINQDNSLVLDLQLFLEGPYNGTNLEPDLNAILPLSQPYCVAPWNYTGTESVAAIPNANVVDWVLIELRDTTQAVYATGETMIAQQAAFLLNDGSVVGLDGIGNQQFNNLTIQQSLFVVIWHRNHLGIMSASPLSETSGVYTYDFTTGANQAYGGSLGHKEIGAGIWGMIGGDGDANSQIGNADKNDVWSVQAGTSGYLSGDFTMDVQVNNSDKNDVWAPNSGKGGQVPDGVPEGGFECQVPE